MFLGNTRAVDEGREGVAQWCYNRLQKDKLSVPVVVCDKAFIPDAYSCDLCIDTDSRNVGKILDAIEKYHINTIISVHYGWVLPAEALKAVNYNAFNLHNAKLPNYKGFNMISHMILNKEKTATTTLHWMDDEVDMGNVAFEITFDILPTDTSRTLYDKLDQAARENFNQLATALKTGREIPKKPIQGTGTFYSKHSLDALKQITNPTDFDEVDLKSRAFDCTPFEPAYYMVNGVKFYVRRTY